MENLYAIGDVHGCLTALESVMEQIDFDANQRGGRAKIVFVGDYIDRGPDSAGVVEYVEGLPSLYPTYDFVFLRGNHEQFILDYYINPYDRIWYMNGGTETIQSYEEKGWDLERHKKFFLSTELYHQHGPYLFVHANIDPELRMEDQREHNFLWARQFDDYRGPYKEADFVVRGHTPGNGVKLLTHQMNIDTACVFGGYLTAVRLPEKPVGAVPEDFVFFTAREQVKNKWASL